MADAGEGKVEIVYVLTNEAMPNMVKIGRTSGDGVERRVAELGRATGVPLPFQVAIARAVDDAVIVERALHIAFGPDRVNPAREFFAIEPYRAIALIKAFPGTDMTPQVERGSEAAIEAVEPGAVQAAKRYNRGHRPNFSFGEMGIPPGSRIVHMVTGEEAIVVDNRKVELRGQILFLTKAQRLVSGADYDAPPTPFWSYEGKSLREIYEETYPHTSHEDASLNDLDGQKA